MKTFKERFRKCMRQKLVATGQEVSDELVDQTIDRIMRIFSGEYAFTESDLQEVERATNRLYPKGKVLSPEEQVKAQAEEGKSPLVNRLTKRVWGYTPEEIQKSLMSDKATDDLSFAKIEKFGRRCVDAFDVQAEDAVSLSVALGGLKE